MSFVWKMLTSRPAGPIATAFALAILLAASIIIASKNGAIAVLTESIQHPETGYAVRLRRAEADLATCRGNTAAMIAGVAVQNHALTELKVAGERRTAELRHQMEQTQRARQAADAEAREILAQRSTGGRCADAEALIREYAR